MTPQDALIELLGRVGANGGNAVQVTAAELTGWPAEAVQAMWDLGLLVKARPASSVVCPGCEQQCVMPVHTIPGGERGPAVFVVCDKRDDINRVAIELNYLEQWQASAESVADLLANLLSLRRPGGGVSHTGRWDVGLFKGVKHSAHLVLTANCKLELTLAGHSMALVDFLDLVDGEFKVDKRALTRRVDQPISGAGDAESASQRRARIRNRVRALKAQGNKAFLKTVSREEGISVSRVKQLLGDAPEVPKARTRR